MVVLAVRFSVSPLHTGVLLAAMGVTGGVGSDKVMGPTILDGHPFTVTRILSYTPAARFGITSVPLPSLASVAGVAGTPLKL